MLVYLIISVVPVFFYFVKPKHAKKTVLFCMVVLFLISTFRDRHMGADYSGYVDYFYRIPDTGTAYFHEQGFIILNRLVSKISLNYWAYAGAINLFLFIPLGIVLSRSIDESNHWIMILIVFVLNPYMYLQTTFNGLRQCCAVGIIILSLDYLKQKKYVKYILIIVLAAQFHRISYAMFILPFITNIKWNKNKWIVATVVSLFLSVFTNRMAAIFSQLFKFKNYETYDSSLLNNPVYIIFLLAYIFFLISQYNELIKDEKNKWYIDLYLLSIVIVLFGVKNDMVYRAKMIISFMSLPALPLVFDRFDSLMKEGNQFFSKYGQLVKIMHVGYYFGFWICYIVYLYMKADPCYIPFKFCS